MPQKKGFKDIEKSLEIIDKLQDALKDFAKAPIKKGLEVFKPSDEEFLDSKSLKMVNDVKGKAFDLSSELEDLQFVLKDVKSDNNSRFARSVVGKFLQRND